MKPPTPDLIARMHTPLSTRRPILPAVWLAWAILLGLACSTRSADIIPPGMVKLPAGIFRPLFRGPDDPVTVSVPAFLLDVRAVTQGEFLEFVRQNPKWRRSQVKALYAEEAYLKNWRGDLELGSDLDPAAPVTFVSWFGTRAYAAWVDKRLPSTAEWEYAASASPSRADGDQDAAFQRQVSAWYAIPSSEKLAVTGQGPANFWGAREMHGLIWEWVADFNTAMVTGDARGDTGLDRQLFCGSGSVGARDSGNYAAFMRYGFRSSLRAEYAVHNLGFRCAKDL